MKKVSKEISDYMRKIGAKGKKNRPKGYCRDMAKARWAKKLSTPPVDNANSKHIIYPE